MITFTNLSRSAEIGSNCYMLDMEGVRIILDSGMHPKKEGLEAQPDFNLIGAGTPDTIFVTHAHLDHIGTLPVLQDRHPSAEVIMTDATAAVGAAMLHNSVNVMTSKRVQEGIIEYPFFTHAELDYAARCWMPHSYGSPFRIGRRGDVLATLHDAGHILGSCGVELESASGTTVLYTGDVQFENQTIIPGARFPERGIDILIMECTHGLKQRSTEYTRAAEMRRFAAAIRETLEHDGAVLIPVFALGKSQCLLRELARFKKQGLIPDAPLYFGGLSAKVTAIYDKLADDTPRMEPGLRLRDITETHGLPKPGKAPLVVSPGNIYLVSSGMMSEHTVSHHIAEQIVTHPKDSILFVGYSDPDSPAGKIKTTNHGDLVRLREKGGQAFPLNCRVESFDFSGHATREALVAYAGRLSPKKVLLVHGDPEAMEWMRSAISKELPDAEVLIPQPGKPCRLD